MYSCITFFCLYKEFYKNRLITFIEHRVNQILFFVFDICFCLFACFCLFLSAVTVVWKKLVSVFHKVIYSVMSSTKIPSKILLISASSSMCIVHEQGGPVIVKWPCHLQFIHSHLHSDVSGLWLCTGILL